MQLASTDPHQERLEAIARADLAVVPKVELCRSLLPMAALAKLLPLDVLQVTPCLYSLIGRSASTPCLCILYDYFPSAQRVGSSGSHLVVMSFLN